jgi:hypothetical protein
MRFIPARHVYFYTGQAWLDCLIGSMKTPEIQYIVSYIIIWMAHKSGMMDGHGHECGKTIGDPSTSPGPGAGSDGRNRCGPWPSCLGISGGQEPISTVAAVRNGKMTWNNVDSWNLLKNVEEITFQKKRGFWSCGFWVIRAGLHMLITLLFFEQWYCDVAGGACFSGLPVAPSSVGPRAEMHYRTCLCRMVAYCNHMSNSIKYIQYICITNDD